VLHERYEAEELFFMLQKEQGFTLVEVLVALVILAMMTTGAFSLLSHSTMGIFMAGDKSEALFEAQGNMEDTILDTQVTGADDDPIDIILQDKTVEINSKTLTVDYEYQGHAGELVYVMPEKTEE